MRFAEVDNNIGIPTEMTFEEKQQIAIDFDHHYHEWPSQDDFPVNEDGRRIKDVILNDLGNSKEYLIITGFTSLANIVEIFGNEPLNIKRKTKILLGFEPQVQKRKSYARTPLSETIKEFWIDKGIDVLKGGMVIHTIEHIKKGNVEFRIKERQHSKIYVGDHHAILGSANFSIQGTTTQKEATIRVGSQPASDSEPSAGQEELNWYQYHSIKQKAQNFWAEGEAYDMQSLLRQLLQKVPWEHALARGLAEILEGNWISNYPEFKRKIDDAGLWPFQISGLAKSMILLDQQGSVLVADPTGSGKTRMVTMCMLTLIHKLWESGKRDQCNSLVLCPKSVVENWEKESMSLSFLNTSPTSMGILQREGRNRNKAIKALRLTNILVLDEAHNFLSRKTNRSNAFKEHNANYVILSTATPINKKADDLLRIIELLGPDNLGDAELEKLKELYGSPIRETKTEDLKKLNRFIQKFILRRTKKRLNQLIEKEQDSYLNKFGNPAKFPQVRNRTYKTAESQKDISIARSIMAETEKLKGLVYLRKFKIPSYIDQEDMDRVSGYYKKRILSATAFTSYHIRNALRSSRPALMEHIVGTKSAKELFDIRGVKPDTGDIITKLESFFELPLPKCDYPNIMPVLLTEKKLYHQALVEEISIYRKILELVKSMSDKRERGKARQLIKLIDKHGLVLGFDSTVLTLLYLRQLIKEEGYSEKVHLVSGSSLKARLDVQEIFGIDSTVERGLALCSDVMAEGVNLQRAKALIQLDFPSVMRLAEQRVGRLHRMDSPYISIEVYWSKDTEAFALKADRRLVKTTILTKWLIGGNLDLPDELLEGEQELMSATEFIKEFKPFEKDDAQWHGLDDAFDPLYRLKEGSGALINEEIYEELKRTKAAIQCRVSFVNSKEDWAFICTKGTDKRAPSWLFVKSSGEVYHEFPAIAQLLRENLLQVQNIEWKKNTLDGFLNIIRKNERNAIPHKKRRALEVADYLLAKQVRAEEDEHVVRLIERLQKAFRMGFHFDEMAIDYSKFAELWLEELKPMLKERRSKASRRELVTLENLKTRWVKRYFEPERLKYIYGHIPLIDQLERRIAACIVGVKT
ncbi:SNF2-related protein [Flagellimonas sp.]|uniref:SNF2-related protein n=1 Tax=Flagellimonas sp. TaxID=2058762 RepID=UPI003BB1EC5B